MENKEIVIYTDGSCHTQHKIGGWAAVIFIDDKKTLIKGKEINTTHNRMEIIAVLKAIDFVKTNNPGAAMIIYSDSQYVCGIRDRKEKLKNKNFLTNKGKLIQNLDLVKDLIYEIENYDISFVKVKAHQKSGDTVNCNREVDKISRKIVRDNVREL